MKFSTTLLAALMTVLSLSAGATDPEDRETVAKVLPSKEAGYIKVLYKNPTSNKVVIKFYGEDGLITRDLVRTGTMKEGFIKVYDLNKLETGDYLLEISDAGMTISYPFTFDENKNSVWAKQWNNYSMDNQILSTTK